jgi:hypothetical protein
MLYLSLIYRRVINMTSMLRPVDHAALKTNQALIILLSILAFILNAPWLVAFVFLAMALGTLAGTSGFGWFYRRLLKPLRLVKPDVLQDHPEPHRFAQGLGALFMGVALALLLAIPGAAGWIMVWIVVGLAALNLFAGFCAGCAAYYWLARLGLPGFIHQPPAGTFPGTRPKVRA